MLSNFLRASILIITLVALLITVARDSDSEDCSILVVLFFPSTDFRHPWVDFRETLPHDAVCSEIVYLL